MSDKSELEKIFRDAVIYGKSFIRDGKHVPVDEVYIKQEEAVSDDLVKRLRYLAKDTEAYEATAMSEAADRIEALEAALQLGIEMREKQKAYFKRRFQDVLLDCKKAEQDFDKAVRVALAGEKKDG